MKNRKKILLQKDMKNISSMKMSYHFQKLYFEEKDEIILQNQGKIPSAEEWILSKKMSVIMKGCILMNRIKSFCKGVDQINSLLIKKKHWNFVSKHDFFSFRATKRLYISIISNWSRISSQSDWCFFGVIFTTMDLSLAVGHVSECPSSGTRGVCSFLTL